jgi:hypothetical protein
MRATRLLTISILSSAIACGGSTTITGTDNTPAPLSATIDGAAWSSHLPSASYTNNLVVVAGVDNAITTTVTFGFAATAPGTYSVGFANTTGGTGIIVKGTKSWGTSLQGGTGSVTLTTVTAHHFVGTFTFNAVPAGGGATGTSVVTNGKFDITF